MVKKMIKSNKRSKATRNRKQKQKQSDQSNKVSTAKTIGSKQQEI